jgi:hypothetical protein
MKSGILGVVLLALIFCIFPYETNAMRVERMENVEVDEKFPIGPTQFNIVAEPGEVITKSIQVDNRFGRAQKFIIEVEDFQGSTEDPDQTVLLQGDEEGRYSAKNWIEPEFWEFTSQNHGERTFFDIVIRIPETADAGDHYGSVLVSAEPEVSLKDTENVGGNIIITSRVGSLFFITVKGDVTEDGALDSFQADNTSYEKAPVNFRSVFRNEGTVRLRPHGEIIIKSMTGATVDTIEVEPYNVLRNSVRGMNYTWNPQKFLIGKYTATITLYNGHNDTPDVQETSFWMVPWKHILAIIITLLVFITGLRFIRKNVEVKVKKK